MVSHVVSSYNSVVTNSSLSYSVQIEIVRFITVDWIHPEEHLKGIASLHEMIDLTSIQTIFAHETKGTNRVEKSLNTGITVNLANNHCFQEN